MSSSCLSYRQLSLASSCIFLCGAILLVIAVIPLWATAEYDDADDRAAVTIVEIVAWTIMASSILPEMWMDVFVKRPKLVVYHGRYGPSNAHPAWNWLQTAMFLGGCICHGMVMKRQWDEDFFYKSDFFREKDYLLDWWKGMYGLSAGLFAASGALAVYWTGCCCRCCNRVDGPLRTDSVQDEDRVNNEMGDDKPMRFQNLLPIANSIYFGASIALLYVIVSNGFCVQCFHGFFATRGAYIAFCVCGVLWLLADTAACRTSHDTLHRAGEVEA